MDSTVVNQAPPLHLCPMPKIVDGHVLYRPAADMFCPYIETSNEEAWALRDMPKPYAVYSVARRAGDPKQRKLGVEIVNANAIVQADAWTSGFLKEERAILKRLSPFTVSVMHNSATFEWTRANLLSLANDHTLTCAASRPEMEALVQFLNGRQTVVITCETRGAHIFTDLSVIVSNSECPGDLCGVFCVWNDALKHMAPGIAACTFAAREAQRLGVRYNLGSSEDTYGYKKRMTTSTEPQRGILLCADPEATLRDFPELAEDFRLDQVNHIFENKRGTPHE